MCFEEASRVLEHVSITFRGMLQGIGDDVVKKSFYENSPAANTDAQATDMEFKAGEVVLAIMFVKEA